MQTHGRRIKRILIAVAIIAGALSFARIWLDRSLNDDRYEPKVLAAPPESLERAIIPPYSGPHPRLAPRPAETFPFPLRSGDVGPAEPLYARENRYPFLCRTTDSDLGQPLVDNQEGWGMAVFAENEEGEATDEIVGYSMDCLLPTRIEYWSVSDEDEAIERLPEKPEHTGSVVRVESGTINRYMYLIMLPLGPADEPDAPDLSAWNRRLIYQLRGGVGIGYRQGHAAIRSLIRRRAEELEAGYAVAYSSGNQTSNHYNIALAEDTLARVKRQFETAYAPPRYTVGVGGSGGAIQQYLIGQNRPGLLDAAIALYSYPDMVTQSIYVLDCEPLEYYFDVNADSPAQWTPASRRAPIVGTNVSEALDSRFHWIERLAELARGQRPRVNAGSTECTRAWRGMTPLVINPHYAHFATRFAEPLRRAVEWTYWADLAHYFGTDAAGRGRRPWDNVGVQYGLRALRAGDITPGQFLDLNRRIGGWKPTGAMEPPRFWLTDAAPSSLKAFSPWDHHNMTVASVADGEPAPRSHGDLDAIAAAYRSGQVFLGRIDMPVIDLRHYLEPELDMHHAVASFTSRLRIQRAMGHADHHLIWMTRPDHQPYAEALDVIDRWLDAAASNPERSLGDNRPTDALDRCWDEQGQLIASGADVWDGDWNGRPTGRCLAVYPHYGTPRTAAGEDLLGDVFKCALQSVDEAMRRGVYGPIDMTAHRHALQEIFPEGVCDYSRPGQGFPPELVEMAGMER